MCLLHGPLGVIYFAVGSRSVNKALRSSISARRHGGVAMETVLVTDDLGRRTAQSLSANASSAFGIFDRVRSVEGQFAEFEATHLVGAGGRGGLRSLRSAKVEAISEALRAYDRVLFLDADTYVCGSLLPLACAVEHPTVAAFVAVEAGREHGVALLKSPWSVPAEAREANTGVLAIRNSTAALRLVAEWRRAYEGIKFFMDQPAFRFALHATGAPHALLPWVYNCRGHVRRGPGRPRHAVPLRCRGFDKVRGEVQTRLRGGKGCVVLHSHDIREFFPLHESPAAVR